jgi:hypothetical protein
MNDYKSFPELKEELGNNYDFKLYEMGISALKEIENLQQENQKYKEVIDKAIEYINHFSKESEVKIYGLPKCKVFIGDIEQLLEILNEVSE